MAMVVVGWSCRTFWLAPWLKEIFWCCAPKQRGGRGFMPRPPRGCGLLYLLILRELEVSDQLRRVVRSGHRQGVAGVRSLGGSLPVVDELVPSGVESQARVFASRGQVLDRIQGLAIEGSAVDLAGRHRTDGLQVLLLGVADTSEELELHRHGRPALDGVHSVVHVHRLVEA